MAWEFGFCAHADFASGGSEVRVEQTDHFKVMREFCDDPAGFVEAAIVE
jgi:hypothetical protein